MTDPAVLASMGFSADAIVYLAPASSEMAPVPQLYGSVDPVQVAHPGNAFRGRASTFAYTSPTGGGDIAFTGGDAFAEVHLNVPSGAVWEATRFWINDTSAVEDMLLVLFRSCQPPEGSGVPVITTLNSFLTLGAGEQHLALTPPAGTVIDNNGCSYFVRVRFDAAGQILRKARTQYRLQVSPAPAVATFPVDVPTNHAFFRFVEALARSGLTGGCGPGAFCPDTPVTRGQLSVFLSVALGLHFPN